ncbi:MAG: hypothetical protein ACI8QC_004251, partial [Planctomycetota bacterium]
RPRVERLGSALADNLTLVLSQLPRRPVGPQILASTLSITLASASRLLKALAQTDPVATLQIIPGPNPLRDILSSSLACGADPDAVKLAAATVDEFDSLIRDEAGDRGSLKAMLSAWLPGERGEFEARKRQTIFKAMCELDGVSSELELSSMLLHPGSDPGFIDIVNIKCLLGIDRMRPDAAVTLGTARLVTKLDGDTKTSETLERPRLPTALDGTPALGGLDAVRLDEFCDAPPAPLEAVRFGTHIQYSLGPTGFGPSSKVDLVIVEVNLNEIPVRDADPKHPPYFCTIPEMATKRLTFDLIVHKDVFPGSDPVLYAYDTAARGPAPACDPKRNLDLRHVSEQLEPLGTGMTRLRLMEFPRYRALIEHVYDRLGCDAGDYRAYRINISHPLTGTQITLAFT